MRGVGRDMYKVIEKIHSQNTFDRILRNVKILSVSNGRCSAEMSVEDGQVTKKGALHLGVASTLVDCVSHYALMSQDNNLHVSVQIHVNFIEAAKVGDSVLLDAWVNKKIKSMAFLALEARDKETKDLLFTGSHTMHVTDVPDQKAIDNLFRN